MAGFNYFEHKADIGIIGRGNTLEQAFIAGATALFQIMTELSELKPKHTLEFNFIESDLELAFVTWLNLLIANARTNGLVLCQFQLTRHDDQWQARAAGETWHADLIRGTEVKGATLTELKVQRDEAGVWEARCVVDV